MTGYWFRHRALLSIILSATIAVIAGLLFVFPYVAQIAANYNSQSVYKNTSIDFIAPEPSFEQINELPSTNGIEKVFPFFLTKTAVSVNGTSRTTTVLLSDQFDNADITMYNDDRLIKKANHDYANALLVDWQFCKDTSSDIGDTVSVSIGGTPVEFQISAVYETNTIYDGGAVLAHISQELKDSIMQNSKSNGYAGMYVKASDYNVCQAYLTQDYRPLGKLKTREQFESDEQYQIHYDAVMSSGYANEITDFRVRESNLETKVSPVMIWIGAALAAVLVIVCNAALSKRGCEKGYFSKHCIPKGQDVKPYYSKTFVIETIVFIIAFVAILAYKYVSSPDYIPKSVLKYELAMIPVAVVIAEIISMTANKLMVNGLIRKEKAKTEKRVQN